ncbi:MFS transporter [Pseudomonas sp. SDI]|uniref:MFS transporter n=1 Tax=Pseudomonas sp. SDI TaxID=2170734 RepID=UPI000DE6F5A9|nr:MFS transporter [Pseudomonas sp. SDI]PWB30088.1 MFS transporter [Pseudomonas sp. SDI]
MSALDAPPGDTDGLPAPQRHLAAAAVMIGILMASLDSAIVNLALPSIARELDVDTGAVIWVANGYLVASAACMLIFAALGNVLGQRAVFTGGLALFTLTSLGCALAGSFEWLVLMRVAQGVAYAAMISIGLSLYRSIFPASALGMVLGLNALIVSFGTAAGPGLGGLIVTYLGWPWLFLINLPFGLLALVCACKAVPQEHPGASGFDGPGAALSALGICLLVLGVERLASLSGGQALLLFAFIGLCFWGFVHRQQRAPFPLVPLDIFASRRFNLAVSASTCVFVAQGLAMVALPFVLQNTYGHSVMHAALVFTTWPLAVVICAPLAGRLCSTMNAALLASIGVLVLAAGLGALALMPLAADTWSIAWRVGLCGVGYGFFLPPNNKELLGNVRKERSTTASGILSTARTLGQSTGAALMALSLMAFSAYSQFQQSAVFVQVVFGGACLIALLASLASLLRVAR